MLAVHVYLAVALVAAASALALPAAAPQDEESGVSQWNEPAIAIGMLSGGRRRRSGGDDGGEGSGGGGTAAPRARRQGDLSEDFAADAFEDADGDLERKVMRRRRQAPRRGIESPFGQTSDAEDRVRRLVRAAQDESKEDDGSVDNDHFAAEDGGKRARRGSEDAYFDDDEDDHDDDDVSIDEASTKRRRQVVGQDAAVGNDEDDVYRDLDDAPLPSWARGARDGRERRQLEEMTAMDDDQPDYIREPRDDSTATSTERPETVTAAPEEQPTTLSAEEHTSSRAEGGTEKVMEPNANAAQDGSEKPAVDSVAVAKTDEAQVAVSTPSSSSARPIYTILQDESGRASPSSSSSDSSEAQPRLRRAPHSPQRFDGFVLTDFHGFRSGRSVRARRDTPSDDVVITALKQAPYDESILGELPLPPLRRPRQAAEVLPQPADGGPVTFLVPLAAPQPAVGQGADAANADAANAANAANASAAAPQKVLQIYTEHVTEAPTTTTPTPSTADPLVPILVPESAVIGILEAGPPAHVDVVPVVQFAAAEAKSAASRQDAPQQAQPLLIMQPGPALVSPTTPQTPFQIPLQIPEDVSHMKQEAPQDAVQTPLVVSQAAHAVAVTEGPAMQPGPISPPQEPRAPMPLPLLPPQATPAEWFPEPPSQAMQAMQPTPFQPRGDAPPRQYFDEEAKPCRPCAVSPSAWGGAVPIVEKTIAVQPDGSYMYSYETADGVRVAESGVLKEIPVQVEEGSAKTAGEAPATTRSNSVQGGYSYTAPDGTYFSVRYVADENGFRPVLGEALPPANARAAVRFDENK